MGWHYRDPMTFPASYHRIVAEAVRFTPNPVLFATVTTGDEIADIKENFRWFKWCAKHQRSAATETRKLLERYDFRCSSDMIDYKFLLYVRAKPTFIADLISLNPKLANEFSAIVNPQ